MTNAFPDILPLYNSSETVQQDSLRIALGDGYEQRLVFGLPANKRLIVITLKYEISETQATTINNFLDARFDDQNSFTFAPTNFTKYTGKNFICTRRSSSFPYLNRVKLNLTFQEVQTP